MLLVLLFTYPCLTFIIYMVPIIILCISTDGSLQRINVGEIDLTNRPDLKLTLFDGFTEEDFWGGEYKEH